MKWLVMDASYSNGKHIIELAGENGARETVALDPAEVYRVLDASGCEPGSSAPLIKRGLEQKGYEDVYVYNDSTKDYFNNNGMRLP